MFKGMCERVVYIYIYIEREREREIDREREKLCAMIQAGLG